MVSSKKEARAGFAQRLGEMLDHIGFPSGRGRAPALAKRYSVSITAARKWLIGTSVPTPARQMLIEQDLQSGDRAIRVRDEPYQIRSSPFAAYEIAPGYRRLPLLTMEVSMGDGAFHDEPSDVVQYLDVAEWWAREHLPMNGERVKIITGKGESMAPLIAHGDIIFVDTSTNYFDGEGLYVFNWNGRALIKRLVPVLRTGKLRIVSANPAYEPEEIAPDELDMLHISGRVVAWYNLRTF